jgi:ATP-dependent Lhr-like helicase
MGLPPEDIEAAMLALEREGAVLRGRFSGGSQIEWCDRRLLARIHRVTLDRLRREIEPVTAAEFLRFLFAWHHADPEHRVDGPLGVATLAGMLQGFQIPAAAWEKDILPARMTRYDPAWLDQLCLAGELAWLRLLPPGEAEGRLAGAHRASPVALLQRDQMQQWMAAVAGTWNGRNRNSRNGHGSGHSFSSHASTVLEYLDSRGASFFHDLVTGTKLLRTEVESGLRELIAAGRVTGDGFAGLRALAIAPDKTLGTSTMKHKDGRPGVLPVLPPTAGRWSALRWPVPPNGTERPSTEAAPMEAAELYSRQLLWRYGVVFHRIIERENGLPPWRDLLQCFRRLEARGEIRGGRFVAGFSGEQYALPEAVQQLRAIRRKPAAGHFIALSAADPLNLAGVLTPGRKIAALATNRILYRDGLPIAAREGAEVLDLHPSAAEFAGEIRARLPP